MIRRLILWLSLAGMVLALHLWIQKARGFDQGCLGVSKPEFVMEGGCRDVSRLPASHLFGVSNATWGSAFYFGMAWLSFVKILASARWARRLHRMSELGVTVASVYSLYLVYQMAHAGVWCLLCLTSALLVATLFGLHALLRVRGGFETPTEPERTAEFRAGVGAVFTAAGGLIAVLLFVDRLGTRGLDQGSTRQEFERLVGEMLPIYIDWAKLKEMRACHIDWNAPPLDLKKFIGPATPFIGRADGIPVFFFLDPNCGYCRNEFPVFRKLAASLGDRARFYVLPRAVWDYSMTQTAALKLAEPSGKYFELWQLMFDRPGKPKVDWTAAEVAVLFQELGLDVTDLEKRLRAVRGDVLAWRATAEKAGINSIPAIYMNGNQVWSENRSEACLSALIDRRRAADKFPP